MVLVGCYVLMIFFVCKDSFIFQYGKIIWHFYFNLSDICLKFAIILSFFCFFTGNIEPNQYVIKIIIRTFVLHPKTVEIQSPPHHLTITNLTTSP